MADRRSEESPLAPHRSLGGRAPAGEEKPPKTSKRPFSERGSAAVSSTGASRVERSDTSAENARPGEGSRSAAGTATTAKKTQAAGKPSSSRQTRPKGTRKARLRLTHVDPWSVMKIAFLLSIALGIVTVVAVALVWSVLGAAGVWDSINDTVQDVLGSQSGGTFNVETYVGTSRVLGFTMIVAVVDVVLFTAIATLGAFLYNLAAALLGGLEVTLAEDEH
ncbi:MAG: DUF3566 domain-containing protein [Actinomycetota bacterium]|nr:DUF3566 domain-containing protein [Actinomycetota bacterium]